MNVEYIFAANANYLSNVYGVDSTRGDPYMGWSTRARSSVITLCSSVLSTGLKADTSTYVSLIRYMFGEVLEVVQFKVSYVTLDYVRKGILYSLPVCKLRRLRSWIEKK